MIEILAEEGVNNFGDTRGGGLAGPTGLFIILVLAIAIVFLIRSMNKRLRRLPAEFPNQDVAHASDDTTMNHSDTSDTSHGSASDSGSSDSSSG